MIDNSYIEWDSELEEIFMSYNFDDDTLRDIEETERKEQAENKFDF